MKIGIAGAGLIGRLIAWQLLRAGHQVTLFDRDSINGERSAARVAAAMLAPFSEAVSCEREIVDWGLQSLQQWPALLAQLRNDGGGDIFFQQRGSIVVSHPQDQAYLDHFNQLLRSRATDYLADIKFLQKENLSDLEPALAAKFNSGTFLQREGCLDNWALLDNLSLCIQQSGGHWHNGISIDTVMPYLIEAQGKQYHFDQVIDSRGLGAKTQLPDLRGVRGEVLWVQAPDVELSRPIRLMHPRYQLYIAPKPNNIYVIGATEIESESMAPITVRSSLELQSALYSINSSFAEASVLKSYANCRPAFANNLPRIDKQEGLLRINGLYRHGYLLAPMVLQTVLTILLDDHANIPMQPILNNPLPINTVTNASAQ